MDLEAADPNAWVDAILRLYSGLIAIGQLRIVYIAAGLLVAYWLAKYRPWFRGGGKD